MSTESMHEFLARVDVFCNFSESELNTIVRITNRRQVKAGDFLCFEGDSGDSMFIVRDGVVRVVRKAETGSDLILARLSSGNIIGEMSLIDEEPRSASLEVESDALVYEIRREAFEDIKDAMDPAAYKLLREISRLLCRRIRNVNQQVYRYIKNPDSLFIPEVESSTVKINDTIRQRINRFLSLFGRGEA